MINQTINTQFARLFPLKQGTERLVVWSFQAREEQRP